MYTFDELKELVSKNQNNEDFFYNEVYIHWRFPSYTIDTMTRFLKSKKLIMAFPNRIGGSHILLANPDFTIGFIAELAFTMSAYKHDFTSNSCNYKLDDEIREILLNCLCESRPYNNEKYAPLNRHIALKAMTERDMDYGDEWINGYQVKAGNKYGDTTSFPVLGYIATEAMYNASEKRYSEWCATLN